MLKKLAMWLITFITSFLISNAFCLNQGQVFICIHIGLSLFLILFGIFLLKFVSSNSEKTLISDLSVITLVVMVLAIASILVISLFVSKLFNVDFYITYQILFLGQCLGTDKIEKRKKPKLNNL